MKPNIRTAGCQCNRLAHADLDRARQEMLRAFLACAVSDDLAAVQAEIDATISAMRQVMEMRHA
jgi:hypothetical protein